MVSCTISNIAGNINNFSLDFKVTKDEFMVGLLGVKGLGKTVLNKIKNGMPSGGGWLDYTEFLQDNFQHKIPSNVIYTDYDGNFDDSLIVSK